MSFDIVCHSCGAKLPIPDDYPRNKMQCPECGVFCPVPPRPVENKKADARQPAPDAARFDNEEPVKPLRSVSPQPPTAIVKAPTRAGEGLVTCPHCGETVRAPERKRGKQGKCPVCKSAWPAPAPPAKPVPPPPRPVPPPPDEFAGSTPDEDPESGNPYRTTDAASRRCPGCSDLLLPEVVVCVRCGFDLRTGRKFVKEYQKIERSWHGGMAPKLRRILFAVCQGLALLAIVASVVLVQDSLVVALPTFFLSWLIFTTLTGFLLGTYDHCDLKRYKSGRVELYQTWRYGFIPWPTKKIDLRDYFTVITRATARDGVWEWLIFIFLLLHCFFPALIYWYCVIHKTEYNVVLSNDIRNLELYVFRGWSEEQMHEIEEILSDALTV
jgi:DNA-directed RNA polymerase subunit M/transcription elongation factor TFIIS